jgi:hypothetical protein
LFAFGIQAFPSISVFLACPTEVLRSRIPFVFGIPFNIHFSKFLAASDEGLRRRVLDRILLLNLHLHLNLAFPSRFDVRHSLFLVPCYSAFGISFDITPLRGDWPGNFSM